MTTLYKRYVAVGDSTTEGLDDPDGTGGYRGWANRLAEKLAQQQGSVLYANLGIRGRIAKQIRAEQLETAVAMRPELATVVAGMNDLMRPGFDANDVGADVEAMQRPLIEQGAVVLTFTLPDLRPIMPLARLLGDRTLRLNDALRQACERSGARLVDFAAYPVAGDPRLWSDDRLHANSAGHARIAEALAYVAGVPGSSDAWMQPLPDPPAPRFGDAIRAEVAWARAHFLPWLWRHMRGRSSGDGRAAKRPQLAPFP
ncbi:MAG TPA: SGNH/GDSL hydrolase family protein [Thermoanaerobaculia bacterium]|jgi:lysophospholipase L1-like esterase